MNSSRIGALVVGLDHYELAAIKPLTGAVADAVEAVRWLRGIGMQDTNLRLHLSTLPASKPFADALGVKYEDAKWDSIWGSIYHLSQQSGDRLFVILSGHGLFEPPNGRLFLTQEYGVNGNLSADLSLDEFAGYFLSLSFTDQFLFVDACQNYASVKAQRGPVVPRGPAIANTVPNPANGLVACYSASVGELSAEIDGRGVMLRSLLKELDPASLATLPPYARRQNAIIYDWTSGTRSVDLRKIFIDFVQGEVQQEAVRQGLRQTPHLRPFERAAQRLTSSVIDLPPEPTAHIVVDVRPPAVVPEVDEVLVKIKMPFHERRLPESQHPIVVPDNCLAPQRVDLEPFCWLRRGSPWRPKIVPTPFTVTNPQHDIVFEFELPPGGPPPTPPGQDLFNLKLRGPAGEPAYELSGTYLPMAAEHGLPLPIEEATAEGIRMILHEDGPDFDVPPGAEGAARRLVADWARAIRKNVTEGVDLVLAPPGRTVEESRPNLAFEFEGTSAGVGGFLTAERLIAIDRADAPDRGPVLLDRSGDYSLGELADMRSLHLEPGRYRIRLELPWGSWTAGVDVPSEGKSLCRLPAEVGLPPLRNRAMPPAAGPPYNHPPDNGSWLLVRGRDPKALREDGFVEPGFVPWRFSWEGWEVFNYHDVFSDRRDALRLRLQPHGTDAAAAGTPLTLMTIPPGDRTLLIDLSGKVPRVEPMANAPMPEWDLLVSAGRIDALPRDRLIALSEFGLYGQDGLFELTVAYAAWVVGAREHLAHLLDVLPDLARWERNALDVDLLRLQLYDEGPNELQQSVCRRVIEGEVPLLRWGVPLAAALFEHDDNPAAIIERTLLPGSVLTAWTVHSIA
jgi:hypothetical protein